MAAAWIPMLGHPYLLLNESWRHLKQFGYIFNRE